MCVEKMSPKAKRNITLFDKVVTLFSSLAVSFLKMPLYTQLYYILFTCRSIQQGVLRMLAICASLLQPKPVAQNKMFNFV